MGIYDRDYYREEERAGGIQLGSPRSVVTILIVINAVLFVVDMLTVRGNDHWFTDNLTMTPEAIAKPWLWWKLLTYGFAHSYGQPMHIVFNMIGLWFFGREVESVYGSKEFVRFYLGAIVLGGVVWSLREFYFGAPGLTQLLGASGGVVAVVLLFCLRFPKRTVLLMMAIPVPAWVLGVILVVSDLFMVSGPHVAYDVHLVGAGFAFCYFQFGWRMTRIVPSLDALRKAGSLKAKPQLRIHDPQGDAEVRYREMDDEADRVLDKIHREGEESLTRRERRILEDYSRRMRQKHR